MVALRLATRGSALARWQAEHVAGRLVAECGVDVELVIVSTEGDRRIDVPLHEIGGKGVFVKEVQAAVLDGRADLAVHSAKDLPALTPPGLTIAAVPPRGDHRDVLVGATLDGLTDGAVVATGSIRRRSQLAALRPDLSFVELRGNIDTRLAKVGEVDAILMARAAIDRLGRDVGAHEVLEPEVMVPQVGQGTLAVECREGDRDTAASLAALDDAVSRRAFSAERAFLVRLGGDCDLPAGAFARIDGDDVDMLAVLATDGGAPRRAVGRERDGDALGARLAAELSGGVS